MCFGPELTFWYKLSGEKTLGIPSRRWADSNKMDLQDVGWGGGMEWIDLAQERDRWRAPVKAVMNFRVP